MKQRLNYFVMTASVAIALSFSTQLANAVVTEEFKLTNDDTLSFDRLGFSVALAGDRVVVGAPQSILSNAGGAVYIFDATTGLQVNKLISDDLAEDDMFGSSVGLSGSTVLVGAPNKKYTTFHEEGAAYLFDLSTGNQTATINRGAPPPGGISVYFHFGASVSISGDTALIGAPNLEPADSAAYLYDLNTANPPLNILQPIPNGTYELGAVVALDGNTAIIGTPNADVGGTGTFPGPGAAFIFDASTGNKTADLLANDGVDEDQFGRAVAVRGNLALVGAPGDSSQGDFTGLAYLFDATTGDQLFKFTADDGLFRDAFGFSVALNDDFAIIGAPGLAGGGAVYLFDLLTGQQITKFSGSDTVDMDGFGRSVAVDGDALIVGAPGVDDGAALSSGAAYLFTIPEPATLAVLLVVGPALISRRHGTRRSAIAR
jgi:outer membrane protein assembly factor BamB